nr:uncharacterized protein LOC107446893 isoform X1 [Parasteatoda tepidariorum]
MHDNEKSSTETDENRIYTLTTDIKKSFYYTDSPDSPKFPAINNKNNKKDETFTIYFYKNHKVCIFKPLIPLKLAQFCWFGAGSFIVAFITVLLKQRGVTLSQFSWMNTIGPIVQIIGTIITGIIADKLGKSKPVLVTNILIVIVLITSLILMPSMIDNTSCTSQQININCSVAGDYRPIKLDHCKLKLQECFVTCPKVTDQNYNSSGLPCLEVLKKNRKLILPTNNETINLQFNNSCYFDLQAMLTKSVINFTCSNMESSCCQISCTGDDCEIQQFNSFLLAGYIVTYVLFLTTYSNVFRCFDVIAMSLVKEYDKSFGHERFFAISGNMFISPLAGVIVNVTTKENGGKNYVAALYFFIGLLILVLIFLYKLRECITPPSKNMLKQTFSLLKKADILSLAAVVLFLGTAWNFTKIYLFWYLEELNASSLLLGLIPSISALYGLPFLISSNWWIKRVGSSHLIVIAFISYAMKTAGYSFILNPWTSLFLEAFGGFTYYLLWVAVVQHSHELALDGTRATVVAVAGALHFSFGKTTASLIGGLVMDSFGGRAAFRLIAIICLTSAILYSIYLYVRHSAGSSRKFKLNTSDK